MAYETHQNGSWFDETGLVAYYKFQNTGDDSSSSGYNLTTAATGESYVAGKFSTAINTSLNTAVISVTGTMGITTATGFTYSVWYRHTTDGEYNTASYILQHALPGMTITPSMIWIGTTSSLLLGIFPPTVSSPVSFVTVMTNVWRHIVVAWGNDVTRVYLDGCQKGVDQSELTSGVTAGYVSRFNLASYLSDAPRRRWINGDFDETLVFSRAWTAGEVAKYYENSKGQFYGQAAF